MEYCLMHWLGKVLGYVPLLGLNVNMGRSFKSYLLEENMPKRIFDLKAGMDEESLGIVDRCLLRICCDPEFYGSRKRNEQVFVRPRDYMDDEELRYVRDFLKKLPTLKKQFPMLSFEHSPEAAYSHNGLISLPQRGLDYLKGKDFIDGGAYIGDSAITFRSYQPRKIWSFDISSVHQKIYEKTMRRNGFTAEQYEFVIAGLYDTTREGKATGNFGLDCSLQNAESDVMESMSLTTLDDFRAKNQLNVGFLKLDIEGSEPQAIQGARETIQKDRPVLSISIYHNPESFFEIKPFLESLGIDYAYHILPLAPPCIPWLPLTHKGWWRIGACSFGETCLFAYPRELGEK